MPMHIATRGILDGEYGKATRGYIIAPDITIRWPSIADIESSRDYYAVVREANWEATILTKGLLAGLDKKGLKAGLSSVRELMARMHDASWQASIQSVNMVALVYDAAHTATLENEDLTSVSSPGGELGSILVQNDIVGSADDGDPQC